MIKILTVCGNGLGSSFACQMATEAVLKELGVEAKLDHIDLSSVSSQSPDLVISGKNFQKQLDRVNLKCPVIYLIGLVDKNEIREKITPALKEIGAL